VKSDFNPLTRALLYGPAKLYQAGVRLRLSLYQNQRLSTHRLQAPVISVGNLTVGGTGKTPLVAFIARFLRNEDFSVAILSRGYKRSARGRVEVSDGKSLLCSPRECGDEPYLLALSCPGVRVVVDKNRYRAGRWLENRAPVSVFILDDGFQHLRLERDLNLLLLDSTEPLERMRMIPFGRLREPLAAMQRADAIIVTRADRPFDRDAFRTVINRHARAGAPVFYASHALTRLRRLSGEKTVNEDYTTAADFAHNRVAAVSGIARPERFISDLQNLGMTIALRRDFRDHHRYSRKQLNRLISEARAAEAEAIIVTEKDAANLPATIIRASSLPLYAAQIEFRCEEEAELKELILQTVKQKREEKAATGMPVI
jgi:tetraacyldisaccharide 4'-kinase